jgi:small subunit ribosomal protein S7
MPRGRQVSKPITKPDEVYKDVRVARFINYVMMDGKKDKAKKIVYMALETAGQKTGQNPLDIFNQVLTTVKPDVEVRSRRVGGANYQIPVPVPQRRGEALAMRWVIDAARGRKGKPMSEKLAEELVNAFNQEGDAVKKKDNVHKMAEANRAFAHFRW